MSDFTSRLITVAGPEAHTETSTVLTLRPLASDDDYARCEALQEATWGEGFKEIASTTMMMISQKVGGIAAGAFDEDGELRGLVFGVSGVKAGHPAHWSHILAVDVAFHGRGIGRHLKAYQRDHLLHLGIVRMYWSYDPLVARNAYLNLQRLAAEPVEYVRDLYGDGGQNLQHRGLGTDRFIVEWRMADDDVDQRLSGGAPEVDGTSPVVNTDPKGQPLEAGFELPEVPVVRVEIPTDIQVLKDDDPAAAIGWRNSTRHAFQGYMDRGYRVRAFQRLKGRCFYLVYAPEETS